jgi:hypothetical protein
MDNNLTLTPNQILTGERLYSEAINTILASAQRELLIFDQDLSHGDFSSVAKFELFQQFLSNNPNSRLTIILQDTQYFQEKCQRLFNLLTVFQHKMTIYETNETVKHAKDCFVLADDAHYIKRIHIDQARFKYAMNDLVSTEALSTRFKEILEATHDVVAVSRLGL